MPNTSRIDKPSLEEYPDWLRDNYDIDLSGGRSEGWYDSIISGLRDQFTQSDFWTTLENRLSGWNDEYRAAKSDYPLLRTMSLPPVDTKRYSSVVGKSYRYNVLQNVRWPSPPIEREEDHYPETTIEEEGDWYGPENWIHDFPDIVRTSLTVGYLDGVIFLADKLESLAIELGVGAEQRFQARPDGYHAVHVLVNQTFDVFSLESMSIVPIQARVEIQVRTQIQETIADLLHSVYETWRLEESPPEGWQWDHGSVDFAVNYLGHTLQYLEGMIVVAREKMQE